MRPRARESMADRSFPCCGHRRCVRRVAVTLIGWFLASSLFAAEKGALLLREDFQRLAAYTKESQPLAAGWSVRVAHGAWERTPEGVKSHWEKGHNPVLVVEGNFGDVIIEVDYRHEEEPGKWAAYRLCAANRALDPRAYAISIWANASFDSRARGLVMENDQWDGPITQVGYARAKFAPGTWSTLRLEIVGDRATAEINGIRISGEHTKFGLAKTSIWLGTGQSAHEIRDLRVYAAVPTAAPAKP